MACKAPLLSVVLLLSPIATRRANRPTIRYTTPLTKYPSLARASSPRRGVALRVATLATPRADGSEWAMITILPVYALAPASRHPNDPRQAKSGARPTGCLLRSSVLPGGVDRLSHLPYFAD